MVKEIGLKVRSWQPSEPNRDGVGSAKPQGLSATGRVYAELPSRKQMQYATEVAKRVDSAVTNTFKLARSLDKDSGGLIKRDIALTASENVDKLSAGFRGLQIISGAYVCYDGAIRKEASKQIQDLEGVSQATADQWSGGIHAVVGVPRMVNDIVKASGATVAPGSVLSLLNNIAMGIFTLTLLWKGGLDLYRAHQVAKFISGLQDIENAEGIESLLKLDDQEMIMLVNEFLKKNGIDFDQLGAEGYASILTSLRDGTAFHSSLLIGDELIHSLKEKINDAYEVKLARFKRRAGPGILAKLEKEGFSLHSRANGVGFEINWGDATIDAVKTCILEGAQAQRSNLLSKAFVQICFGVGVGVIFVARLFNGADWIASLGYILVWIAATYGLGNAIYEAYNNRVFHKVGLKLLEISSRVGSAFASRPPESYQILLRVDSYSENEKENRRKKLGLSYDSLPRFGRELVE